MQDAWRWGTEVKQIDGHYQLPLNNLMMVEMRMNQLKRRFRRDNSYFQFCKTFMDDMLEKEYAKKSTSPAPLGTSSWFLQFQQTW